MSNDIQIVSEEAIVFDMGYNQKPIIIVLKDTKIAEQSVEHIRTANPSTFPDLITIFTSSIVELARATGSLKTGLVKLEHRLEYIRANLLINKVPLLAEQKGIKLTAPVAEALIMLDPEYNALLLLKDEVKNSVEGLEAKYKAINTAYFAIKAVSDMKFGGGYRIDPDPGMPEDGRMGTITRKNQFRGEF